MIENFIKFDLKLNLFTRMKNLFRFEHQSDFLQPFKMNFLDKEKKLKKNFKLC